MEQLFWRTRPDWIKHPVCNWSEGMWLQYLFDAQYDPSLLTVSYRSLTIPNHPDILAHVITKTQACNPTSVVVNCDKSELLGAILGIKNQASHPLRPLRPQAVYTDEEPFGLKLANLKDHAGFDESDPFISVFIELLKRLDVPVNHHLPEVAQSYWPE